MIEVIGYIALCLILVFVFILLYLTYVVISGARKFTKNIEDQVAYIKQQNKKVKVSVKNPTGISVQPKIIKVVGNRDIKKNQDREITDFFDLGFGYHFHEMFNDGASIGKHKHEGVSKSCLNESSRKSSSHEGCGENSHSSSSSSSGGNDE